MGGVVLGMPGQWADSNYEIADTYTTKIGGIPDFPFPIPSEKQYLLECSTCGGCLCLLAQIYAPISRKSSAIDERVIYVFGCVLQHCASVCWRALRVQKISSNEVMHVPTSPRSIPNSNWQKNLWSFDIRDESGRENDDDDDDDIDLDELVMPCFYIYTQEEKLSKRVTSGSSKNPLLSVQERDYDSKEQSKEEIYEEEKYEYDRALNADRTYLKFKKRMDAYPEQCFRYSYGGKPLFACGEIGDHGICKLCGGARHYEMQLMPPLIYFLQEAADDQQMLFLERFDWMTLLVYTCSKNCADSSYQVKSGGEDWLVSEEAVIVQFE